ncbi:MAG: molybdopterin-guanine dinucleotide biosynthesis protein MobA [Cereibacter sphaeroides]|uniref:Molybdopterin-guanine dinucleotide biosynthesis protein MobA n=1 Tax=Cereibacter sphaeroides TaxID=1063 RepID=A0A2W5UDY1_CERSP|nr:MAG: molybdopterin-guanine dinucleotide biosynthesis protein MobA [Cereibacter sphaeroides]
MAAYHLSVKTIKRSAGRSALAAAAYRSASVTGCDCESRLHDDTAERGVVATFILAPKGAADLVHDRAALWNAAEARETRSNSVTAREWELALPSEISDAERIEITRAFAAQLVERYGVAADVAIHVPHREGDQRNHHAHILATTRVLSAGGLTDKTRVLDAASTGGPEIEAMRGVWAELQNRALERVEVADRVDHRSLEIQRHDALSRGDELAARALDRPPEVKLGPAVNALERRAARQDAAQGREYIPRTERGAAIHALRMSRQLYAEMRERVDRAREAYDTARDEGQGRVSAGLAALRAAAGRGREREAERDAGKDQGEGADNIRARLGQILGRDEHAREGDDIRQRLAKVLGKGKAAERDPGAEQGQGRDAGYEWGRERERDEGWEL